MTKSIGSRRPRFLSRDTARVFDAVLEAGWEWRAGKSHIVIKRPGGWETPLILSVNAFDGPATKRMIAQFRRAGLPL